MTTGKIFLSGGGDEKATQVLDNIFFKETSVNKETDKKAFRECIIEFKKEVERRKGE